MNVDDVIELLRTKNQAYGNSALSPLRIWASADAMEQIRVRIDDKLSRLARGDRTELVPEDTVKDLVGYLVLLDIARAMTEGPVSFDDALVARQQMLTDLCRVSPQPGYGSQETILDGARVWAGSDSPLRFAAHLINGSQP